MHILYPSLESRKWSANHYAVRSLSRASRAGWYRRPHRLGVSTIKLQSCYHPKLWGKQSSQGWSQAELFRRFQGVIVPAQLTAHAEGTTEGSRMIQATGHSPIEWTSCSHRITFAPYEPCSQSLLLAGALDWTAESSTGQRQAYDLWWGYSREKTSAWTFCLLSLLSQG